MAKSLAEQVAELKERRAETIFRVKAEHTEDDDPGGWNALRAAERHEDVLAIDREIGELRAQQREEDPEAARSVDTPEERRAYAAQVYLETEHLREDRRDAIRARTGARAIREQAVRAHDDAIAKIARARDEEGE